ncbi:enoyl-CoA hydratase-related protein [Alloalcanivorax marinus]|uniref:enoyl-CoA hydratase-related protein n=1 Tax=Alloalcanivorax marinus TaxID=1177169 RepID=UPI0021D0A8E4|nr:enoyl-CoA hydratase-related protein [Alloalcanivorax marinus]
MIVTGAGRAFCAGMEMQPEDGGHVFGYDDAEGETPPLDTIRDSGGEVSLAIFNCRKPVIGALNGAAVGVGITMTLPMDFRLAAHGAKIGFVFSQRGLTPEACSSWFLPRLVPMHKALEWVYSGDIFLAEEGLEAGLFRSLHDKESVLDAARELAHKLVAKSSPVSVALAKQMLWRNPVFDHPMRAHAVETRLIYRSNEFWDGKDGFPAFLEKRDPVFDTNLNDLPRDFGFWPEPPLK